MRRKKDLLYSRILSLVTSSNEPFETKEIEEALPKFTRIMILYRLNILRGDGKINGKQIGSGKGAWVWWKTQKKDLGSKKIAIAHKNKDLLYSRILGLVIGSSEPLETKEIEEALPKFTRIMILYRLNMLRGESRINGKQIGSGKGAWVWWKKSG